MIAIAGGGAFGTALAVALAREGNDVVLWARNASPGMVEMPRLPGFELPGNVSVTADFTALRGNGPLLLAIPAQQLSSFLAARAGEIDGRPIVACSKGIDLTTLRGAAFLIAAACPASVAAVLTGPSFAADIARGLPTALTLACGDDGVGERLQAELSTRTLRLYRTTDVAGAELGGALKNVIAIAAGVVMGAGLGDSARAALMTRGYAEMLRLALALGARPETLAGLSGLGDLVLTCTSTQSRNFGFGFALGSGQPFDSGITVEGAVTARAAAAISAQMSLEMPIASMVAALVDGAVTVPEAMEFLLSRPLKQE
ncbi:MAG: glycerol-3-phosphate dehydrogenase [Cereibacter sphaeroides]|uniref:Glycerol-3-phosphate dehydrogenase [NAD(P)+] n=1 Tax=Cereibacter sphaeroides TaxID=1063 RepID=A0A2W5SEJ3_CERSP|nr:MAG: glycerol-3-phosphate dehydrogenase [Cereibacter sphaeroides]